MAVQRYRGFRRQVTPYEDEILKSVLRGTPTSASQYAAEGALGMPIANLTADYLKGARKRQAKNEAQIAMDDTMKARSLVQQLINDPNTTISPTGDITQGTTVQSDPTDMNYQTVTPQDVSAEALAGRTIDQPTSFQFGPDKDPNFIDRRLFGASLKQENLDNIYDIMNKAQIPFEAQQDLLTKGKDSEFTYERDTVDGVTTQYKINKQGQVVGQEVLGDLSEAKAQNEYMITYRDGTTARVQGQSIDNELQISDPNVEGGKFISTTDLSKVKPYESLVKYEAPDIRKQRLPGQTKVSEELGLAGAKRFNTQYDSSLNAVNELSQIDELLTLISRQDTPSGTFGNLIPKIMTLGKSLGFISADAQDTIANARMVETQLASRTLANVKKLTGPITEKELRFLQDMVANMTDTKESQRSILLYSKYILNKQANFSKYIAEKHPNYDENATGASLRKIEREFLNSDMNKQNFIAYTEQEILNDAKILARKLDNNSQFYDPNYNQQLYQQDLDYLNKDKYNIEYLRKNFRLGR
jgi:hypothetical protein